jgi:hypothetical protein
MQEALTLFDSICNSRWFVKTSIILFLNKIDLFAEKLPRSPLADYFPDYQGGANYDAACDYLLHRFVSLNQSAATKQIYAHYTCATDTQQIKCEWRVFLRVFFCFFFLFSSCFLLAWMGLPLRRFLCGLGVVSVAWARPAFEERRLDEMLMATSALPSFRLFTPCFPHPLTSLHTLSTDPRASFLHSRPQRDPGHPAPAAPP